ncbi:MAG: RNA polymerase sigma factor [Planctomycetota bacterium]
MTRRSNDAEPDFADLSARVYRLCLALLGDEVDARDAAQEAFVRAWSRRKRKRRGVGWWTWLAGFAIRVCRETRRRRASVRSLRSDTEQEPTTVLTRSSENAATSRQFELHQAITALADRQREVTVLRFILGMSTREAAETLRCPIGTVKSNLHKALARLKAALQQRETIDEVHRL